MRNKELIGCYQWREKSIWKDRVVESSSLISGLPPPEVFSRQDNRNALDPLAEIRSEVANIAGEQISASGFHSYEYDRHIFLRQRNSTRKFPARRFEQLDLL